MASFSWPTIVIAVGSFIAVGGAFWAALEQGSTDRELRDLGKENTRLATELKNYVTGGDSYPVAFYAPPVLSTNDPNILSVEISIKGQYPLLDASFEHVDLTEQIPETFASVVEENAVLRRMVLPALQGGTIYAKILKPVGFIQLRSEDSRKDLKLTTFARNGMFVQRTELKRDEGDYWRTAHCAVYKVIPGQEPQVLPCDGG